MVTILNAIISQLWTYKNIMRTGLIQNKFPLWNSIESGIYFKQSVARYKKWTEILFLTDSYGVEKLALTFVDSNNFKLANIYLAIISTILIIEYRISLEFQVDFLQHNVFHELPCSQKRERTCNTPSTKSGWSFYVLVWDLSV